MEILELMCKQWQCVVFGCMMAGGMLLIAVLDSQLGTFAAFHKIFSFVSRVVAFVRCFWRTVLSNGLFLFGNCVEENFISRDK